MSFFCNTERFLMRVVMIADFDRQFHAKWERLNVFVQRSGCSNRIREED